MDLNTALYLQAGTKLRGGAFTTGKMLGQGGFGITYLGSDVRLRRAVAIKEYFPQGGTAAGRHHSITRRWNDSRGFSGFQATLY